MSSHILVTKGLVKSYDIKDGRLEVLKGIDLRIERGDGVSIMGASGSGKSTLLHILGTLDQPTLGKVFYKGEDLGQKSDDQLATFRNLKMGFVFQFHHLLPELNALENASLPVRIAGEKKADAEEKALILLRHMGMEDRRDHYPSEMSGGERQRVAISRALIQEPEILFADEPTGNLDSSNGAVIQDLFFKLKEELGLTLVVVTHDPQFAKRFPTRYALEDGAFVDPDQSHMVL